MPRYANNRDKNEREIIDTMQAFGCFVWQRLPVDLIVASPRTRMIHLLEVKSKGGTLRPVQKTFFELTGDRYPVAIVRSVDEALSAVGVK